MTGSRLRSSWLALALALGGLAAVRGDEPLPAVFPAESKATAGRIDEIRKLLADKKWPQAVEEIQSVLTASGDDLVAIDPERCVACRRLCHALLASLPPDALRSYRAEADPQARKQLDQAVAAHDVRLLRKVVDEAFCSRPGEKALDLLGDLAFERGDFAEAEQWWRLLLPPRMVKGDPPPAFLLYYPDPQTDPGPDAGQAAAGPAVRAAPTAGPTIWRLTARSSARPRGAGRQERPLRRHPARGRRRTQRRPAGPDGRLADLRRRRRARPDRRRAAAPAGKDGALCRPANEQQYSLKDRQAVGGGPSLRPRRRPDPGQPFDGLRAGRRRRQGDRR